MSTSSSTAAARRAFHRPLDFAGEQSLLGRMLLSEDAIAEVFTVSAELDGRGR